MPISVWHVAGMRSTECRLVAVCFALSQCVCLRLTFRVSRRRCEMYCGHPRLCVCVSVRGRMPTLLHGPGCNLGEW